MRSPSVRLVFLCHFIVNLHLPVGLLVQFLLSLVEFASRKRFSHNNVELAGAGSPFRVHVIALASHAQSPPLMIIEGLFKFSRNQVFRAAVTQVYASGGMFADRVTCLNHEFPNGTMEQQTVIKTFLPFTT